MPVLIDRDFDILDQDQFMALDFEIMKHSFAIHNKYGNLCDEKVYADELAYRCETHKLDVCRELQIKVTHKSFEKLYYVDLVNWLRTKLTPYAIPKLNRYNFTGFPRSNCTEIPEAVVKT